MPVDRVQILQILRKSQQSCSSRMRKGEQLSNKFSNSFHSFNHSSFWKWKILFAFNYSLTRRSNKVNSVYKVRKRDDDQSKTDRKEKWIYPLFFRNTLNQYSFVSHFLIFTCKEVTNWSGFKTIQEIVLRLYSVELGSLLSY